MALMPRSVVISNRRASARRSCISHALGAMPKAIQFRQTILERDTSDTQPWSLTFEAFLANEADDPDPTTISLAVERPWLYRLTVNDQAIDTIDSEHAPHYFDEAMRLLPIGFALRPGANAITVSADAMHPLMELSPIWLHGPGGVHAREHGFAWGAAPSLELGDIGHQGHPTYRGCVRYRLELDLPRPLGRWRIAAPQWAGSALRVEHQGTVIARSLFPGRDLVIAHPFSAGTYTIDLVVVGDLGNLLGPHHGPGLAGRWSWERPWEPDPAVTPPGAAYRRQAHGLLALPTISALDAGSPEK